MSGGGSKKGRVLKPYRYSNFWPRQAQEAVLDRAFMAWPVDRIRRLTNRIAGVRQNVAIRL